MKNYTHEIIRSGKCKHFWKPDRTWTVKQLQI